LDNIVINKTIEIHENKIEEIKIYDYSKKDIDTSLAFIDFKNKKLIEPYKIIIKDYQLTEQQISI